MYGIHDIFIGRINVVDQCMNQNTNVSKRKPPKFNGNVISFDGDIPVKIIEDEDENGYSWRATRIDLETIKFSCSGMHTSKCWIS